MNPNWDAFRYALGVLIVATPFMFGVLSLFAISTYLLSRIPDRVARLVMLNTSAYPDSLSWSWIARLPGFGALFAALFRNKATFRWLMRSWFRFHHEGLISEFQRVYADPLTSRTMLRLASAWTPRVVTEIAAGLHRLSCPVHLIWGIEDRYIFPFEPSGERFLRDFPGVGLTQIPGAAHFVQAERPEAVLAALEQFLGT